MTLLTIYTVVFSHPLPLADCFSFFFGGGGGGGGKLNPLGEKLPLPPPT